MNKDKISKLSAKQTAMLGALIGDAIGMPHEFKSAHMIDKEFVDYPLHITNHYKTYGAPLGVYTDDFSQQLCVERHFRTWPVDTHAFYQDMLMWQQGSYWVDFDKFDEGNQTYKQLDYYRKKGTIRMNDQNESGNGSLMRILPVAFMDCDDTQATVAAFLCSTLTHNTQEAVKACQFYVQLVRELQRDIEGDVWKRTAKKVDFDPYCENYEEGGGYVVATMCALKDIIANSTSFVEAIKRSILMGGDTDTTACVVGGVAALVFGLDDLPEDWLQFIQPSLQEPNVRELFDL